MMFSPQFYSLCPASPVSLPHTTLSSSCFLSHHKRPQQNPHVLLGSSASFDSRPLMCASFPWPHSIPGDPGAPGNPDGPNDPGIIQGKVTPVNDNTWNCELIESEKSLPSHAPFLLFYLVDNHYVPTQQLGAHTKSLTSETLGRNY